MSILSSVLVACLGSTPALAADDYPDTPKDRLFYTEALFGRMNPLGLANYLNIGWQRRLFDSDSLLLDNTHLFLAFSSAVSPAYARLGVRVEVVPVQILRLVASYHYVGHFGTFDQVLSFPHPFFRFSEYNITTWSQAGQAQPTYGGVLTLSGRLQGKVGPIAVRSEFTGEQFHYRLPHGHTYMLDAQSDRPVQNFNWAVNNNLDVLALPTDKLTVGARWSWTDSYGFPVGSDAAQAHNRIGPLFAYTFHDRGPGAKFDQPTLFMLFQWYATHPYRTGDEIRGWVPLAAIGLAFQGDLWTSRD